MEARELRCPGCFAPVEPSNGALWKCRYCGATVAVSGAPAAAAPAAVGAPVFLEDVGANKIAVIKVVREHTGLGLREAKELVERAPCVLAEWREPLRLMDFREDLVRAGARVR